MVVSIRPSSLQSVVLSLALATFRSVTKGEALFHIACFDADEIPLASEMVETFVEAYPDRLS